MSRRTDVKDVIFVDMYCRSGRRRQSLVPLMGMG